MDVIGHETVGIETTGLTYDVALVIIFMLEVFEELEESLAVGVIGKDVLAIDASEHDVVDA